MEHKEIKLNELVISGTEDKMDYVQMLVPEEWTSRIKTFKDSYGGSKYPYQFTIFHDSPDKTATIYYYSPVNFVDDHLKQFNDYEIDEYGNWLRAAREMPVVLDRSVLHRFRDYNMERINHIPFSNNEKIYKERYQGYVDDVAKQGNSLNSYYYYGGINIYKYTNKNRERIRMASAIVDGYYYSRWQEVPQAYMMSMMGVDPSYVYPNYQYDQYSKKYVYTIMDQADWRFYCHLEMDVLKEDYEYAYKNIFLPVVNKGVVICDDIWQDFRKEKERMSKERAAIRQDRKEAARIQREADERRRQSNKELYDYVRKTQQEISDMRKDSYEKQKKAHDRVMEQWTDTIRGNTRFVDKQGNEHVIHTYNDYAFKKGDDYITSNSSLDHFSDWEELEKKKY